MSVQPCLYYLYTRNISQPKQTRTSCLWCFSLPMSSNQESQSLSVQAWNCSCSYDFPALLDCPLLLGPKVNSSSCVLVKYAVTARRKSTDTKKWSWEVGSFQGTTMMWPRDSSNFGTGIWEECRWVWSNPAYKTF